MLAWPTKSHTPFARATKIFSAGMLAAAATCAPALAADDVLDPAQLPYYDKTGATAKADIAAYLAAKAPKALAIHPNGATYWWGSVASTQEASRRALQNCELLQKSPCVLAAVDHVVRQPDAKALESSAFADVGSELDPERVPFLGDAARKKLRATYAKERKNAFQYMALALHPRNAWYLKVDPSFKSQEEANEAALAACVAAPPPNRYWKRGECLLFAEGSRVVATLPHAVRYASAAMVKAAEDGQSVASAASTAAPVPMEPKPPVNVAATAAPAGPKRIIFVHTGGNDCPPCRAWRAAELPKLQQSPIFRSVQFSFVTKAIMAPFPPPESMLPAELKPLHAKLQTAAGGRPGSPQQMLIVDGEVYDYWVGSGRGAEDILARIAAITNGTEYPGRRCVRSLPYPHGDLHCTQYEPAK